MHNITVLRLGRFTSSKYKRMEIENIRFNVFMAVKIWIVFWILTPCSLVRKYVKYIFFLRFVKLLLETALRFYSKYLGISSRDRYPDMLGHYIQQELGICSTEIYTILLRGRNMWSLPRSRYDLLSLSDSDSEDLNCTALELIFYWVSLRMAQLL
jgi:hypothetical protein